VSLLVLILPGLVLLALFNLISSFYLWITQFCFEFSFINYLQIHILTKEFDY